MLESKKANSKIKISSEGIYTYIHVETTLFGGGMFLSSVSTVQEYEMEQGSMVYEVQSKSLASDGEIQYWILLYDSDDDLIQIHMKKRAQGQIIYTTFQ